MSTDSPKHFSGDGSAFSIAVVFAAYNGRYVDALRASVRRTLKEAGVMDGNLTSLEVPGSNELPYAVSMLSATGDYDCVIALGVVIAGETPHHEIIAHSTADALHRISRESETPVINGIVVVNNEAQAEARCGSEIDRGSEYARAALHMAALKQSLVQRLDEIYHEEDEDSPGSKSKWQGFIPGQSDQPWKS